MVEALAPVVMLVGLGALALAALRWGADSRLDQGRDRPRRWFVHLTDPGSGPAEGGDRGRGDRAGHGPRPVPFTRTRPRPPLPVAMVRAGPAAAGEGQGSDPFPRPRGPAHLPDRHDLEHEDGRGDPQATRPATAADRR